MALSLKLAAGVIGATMLSGCGLLPTDASGDERYSRDFDTCSSRGAAEYERTRQLLGQDRGAIDSGDPLSPGNISASRAHRELSDCMRSKGWPDSGPSPGTPRAE